MTAPAPRSPRTLIVMGVCGCGKSLIGARLAAALGGVFEDADDFHTDASKAKMRAGTPLTDDDRWPWFEALRARIEAMREQTPVYVLACSALKAVYRERLRAGDGPDDLVFLHLKGSRELIFGRMSARQGHYMPVSLLDSQLSILEETPDLWTVAIDREPEAIAAEILDRLAAPRP
jgi:gluconokinase